jgi:predicted protein tyrosine phosphatase
MIVRLRILSIYDAKIVEKQTEEPFISIQCPGDEPIMLDRPRTLKLWFYDIHPHGAAGFDDYLKEPAISQIANARCMVPADADKIVAFVQEQDKVESKTETLFIHCTAGISRSGGVGVALRQCMGLDLDTFKQWNPQIIPNWWCSGLVERAWHKAT